jgi:hypothetical protein
MKKFELISVLVLVSIEMERLVFKTFENEDYFIIDI